MCERLCQPAVRPVGPRLDGAERHRKLFGDLVVGQPDEVLQSDYLSFVGGQRLNGLTDFPRFPGGLEARWKYGAIYIVRRVGLDRSTFLAIDINGDATCNCIEPRGDRPVLLIGRSRPPCLQECLLNGVCCQFAIVEDAQSHCEHRSRKAPVKQTYCFFVGLAKAFGQLLIVHRRLGMQVDSDPCAQGGLPSVVVVTVQLYVTCLVDGFAPQVGEAAVRLLEQAGCEVQFPLDQTCCGQPAFNAGFTEQAKRMAKHNVDVLAQTTGPIVVPSGSCADMLSHHVPHLLESDQQAASVASRVKELSAFLVDDLGLTQIGRSACDGCRVAYHPSCHGFRNLGITDQPKRLLGSQLELVELEDSDQCCGFGGLFAVELPEVSGAMLEAKLNAIEKAGVDTVTATDVGCLMHMAGGAHRRGWSIDFRHWAELLTGDEP